MQHPAGVLWSRFLIRRTDKPPACSGINLQNLRCRLCFLSFYLLFNASLVAAISFFFFFFRGRSWTFFPTGSSFLTFVIIMCPCEYLCEVSFKVLTLFVRQSKGSDGIICQNLGRTLRLKLYISLCMECTLDSGTQEFCCTNQCKQKKTIILKN